MSVALQYLSRSDAIWFISRWVVADHLARGVAIELPIDVSDTSGPVGVVTRTDEVLGPPVEPFVKLSGEIAGRPRLSPRWAALRVLVWGSQSISFPLPFHQRQERNLKWCQPSARGPGGQIREALGMGQSSCVVESIVILRVR